MFWYFTLLSSIATFFIARKKFSKELEEFQVVSAWYAMKTYCLVEIVVQTIFAPLRQLIITYTSPLERSCIIFINHEGKEIVRHTDTEFKLLQEQLKQKMDYELIVYEFEVEEEPSESVHRHKKCMLLFDDHMKVSDNFKINSKVKFIGIQLKIFSKNDYYNVTLGLGENNYYITGNKLFTPVFLNWYLNDLQ